MVIVVKCAVWDANVNIRRSVDLEFLLHLNAIMRRKSVAQLKKKHKCDVCHPPPIPSEKNTSSTGGTLSSDYKIPRKTVKVQVYILTFNYNFFLNLFIYDIAL